MPVQESAFSRDRQQPGQRPQPRFSARIRVNTGPGRFTELGVIGPWPSPRRPRRRRRRGRARGRSNSRGSRNGRGRTSSTSTSGTPRRRERPSRSPSRHDPNGRGRTSIASTSRNPRPRRRPPEPPQHSAQGHPGEDAEALPVCQRAWTDGSAVSRTLPFPRPPYLAISGCPYLANVAFRPSQTSA